MQKSIFFPFFVFLGGLCVCCSLASEIPDEVMYSIYFLHKGKINLLSYALFWRMSLCWKRHRMSCKTKNYQSLQTINYCGWCLKTEAVFSCKVVFPAVDFLPHAEQVASNQWPHEWRLIWSLIYSQTFQCAERKQQWNLWELAGVVYLHHKTFVWEIERTALSLNVCLEFQFNMSFSQQCATPTDCVRIDVV